MRCRLNCCNSCPQYLSDPRPTLQVSVLLLIFPQDDECDVAWPCPVCTSQNYGTTNLSCHGLSHEWTATVSIDAHFMLSTLLHSCDTFVKLWFNSSKKNLVLRSWLVPALSLCHKPQSPAVTETDWLSKPTKNHKMQFARCLSKYYKVSQLWPETHFSR